VLLTLDNKNSQYLLCFKVLRFIFSYYKSQKDQEIAEKQRLESMLKLLDSQIEEQEERIEKLETEYREKVEATENRYKVKTRASAENFPGGRANGKKYRKIALFSLFQGVPTEKRPKNITFKPLSTIFVPCMKIPPAPRCRRPWVKRLFYKSIFFKNIFSILKKIKGGGVKLMKKCYSTSN